ncbi:MAG: hypothetical protein NTV25_03660 [Methanothrix sp.]|nr:hypothetical protein [Methanothrix sp.]
MKIKATFFVVMVVVLAAFCVTLAFGIVTTFKTGPFTGSIDLGVPCNDVNMSKPVSSELLSGDKYTNYDVNMCNVRLTFTRFDKPLLDVTSVMGNVGVETSLIISGCDKDTISLYPREINKMSGTVGKGYKSESGSTLYMARYYISSYAFGDIQIWDNETMMISALKTIHVTEAAT